MTARPTIGLCALLAAMALSAIPAGAPWPLMVVMAIAWVCIGLLCWKVGISDRRLIATAEHLVDAEEGEDDEDTLVLKLIDEARRHNTPYLLNTWERGAQLGHPWPFLKIAIEVVLDERDVPIPVNIHQEW